MLELKLGFNFDIVNPGNENSSLRMHANFVSTSKRFRDLQQGKKRILLSPLAGSIFILKDNSNKDKSILSERQLVIHPET